MKSATANRVARKALSVTLCVSALVLALWVLTPRIGRHENAKEIASSVDISNFCSAIDGFRDDCGRFPTTEEGLQALTLHPSGVDGWKGPYLQMGVHPDAWGNAYVYRCPGEHNKSTFDLCSFGPDGREGGGDDIDNWNHN